jgi:hypothetical protein
VRKFSGLRSRWVIPGALALTGCGAAALTPRQRAALLQRISDQGEVAKAAVRARDAARGGKADSATIDFISSETAALVADVGSALR